MSQKFTILFDLDGTLVNTAPDLMHAHNHVMKKYGYGEKKLPDIKKLAGRGSKAISNSSIRGYQRGTKNLALQIPRLPRALDDWYSHVFQGLWPPYR